MMILLDTNVLLFMLDSPKKLPTAWRETLRSPDAELLVSVASIWEIAIKTNLKRSNFIVDPQEVVDICKLWNIGLVDITSKVVTGVMSLPLHHKDPFDRLIIAQALELGIPVMTTDKMFKKYDVALA